MKNSTWPPFRFAVCLGFLLCVAAEAHAQTFTVSNETQLRNAVMTSAADPLNVYIISLSTSITLTGPLPNLQSGVGGLTINGNGHTLTGVGNGISLFRVQTGAVAINDLIYSDDTTALAAGTLLLNAGDSLGTGGVVLNNGTLRSGDAITVANAIDLTGTAKWDTNGFDTIFTGALTGTGGLTKRGLGTLTFDFSATPNYSGNTSIEAGTLSLRDSNSFNSASTVSVSNGASLDISASASQSVAALNVSAGGTVGLGTASLVLSGSGNSTLDGVISGGGSLYVLGGSGGTINVNGQQQYFGQTIIGAGEMRLNVDGALAYSNVDMFGGTLTVNASQTVARLSGSSGGLNLCNLCTGLSSSLNVNQFSDSSFAGFLFGAGSLNKSGTGRLQLTGSNFLYSGNTSVTGGVVELSFGTGLGTGNITLAGGGLLAGSTMTMSNNFTFGAGGGTWNTFTNDVTLTGDLTGAGSLTKTGAGMLILQGNNATFSGPTIVTGGGIGLSSANSLGSGSVTLDGGKLRSDASIIFNNQIVLGAGGGTWDTNGNNTNLVANMAGAGAFTKSGAGVLFLLGNNSAFSGDMTVTGGVVALSANNNLGTGGVTLDGGGARSAISLNIANNITFGAGGGTWDTNGNFTTLSGNLTGVGGFTKNGSGMLVLGGLNNSYSGGTTINGGSVALSANSSLGSGNVTVNGADLRSDAAITVANGFTFGASGANWDTNGNNTTVSGAMGGVGPFAKNGAGILTLSGANTYSGSTYVFNGTLRVTGADALASSSQVSVGASTTLDFANTSQKLQTLFTDTGGTVDLGSGTLTLEGTNASFFNGVITGSGGLVLNGAATYVAVNTQQTYTGGTTINGGTLYLANGVTNALAAGAVTVNGSGQLQVDGTLRVLSLSGNSGADALLLCGCGTFTLDQSTSTLFAGEVYGNGAFIKNGSGTLALAFNNTRYVGAVSVNGGVIALGANDSLGLGSGAAVTLNGGELRSDAAISVAKFIDFDGLGGTWNTNGNNTTLSGALGGVGAFTKTGTGTLTLTSIFNSWAGGTTVNAGVLQAGIAGALVNNTDYVVNGGTLDLNGFDLTAYSLSGTGGGIALGAGGLTVSQSASTTFAGTISGIGDLFKDGAGTLTLSSAQTHSGLTGVVGGTLQLTAANALANSAGVFVNSSGLIDFANTSQTLQALAIGAGSTVDIGSGTLTIDGSLTPNFTALNGAITGTGRLVVNGSATTVFVDAQQTYTGGTTINDGVMFLGVNDALLNTSALTINGGDVIVEANQTIGSLSGLGGFIDLCFCGPGELTVNQSTNTTFAGDIGGDGSLTKNGAGTLVFTGNLLHVGGTTVNGGRLQLGTTTNNSALLDGDVNVQTGGALGGTGTITGTVNVGAGATLAPGASIGTLTTGTLTLDASSILDFEFGAAGISDRVIVNGDLTLDGTLNVIDAGGFGAGVYRLFDYSGLFTDGGLVIGATPNGVTASQLLIQTSVANQVNLISAAGIGLTFWDGAGPAGNGVINGGSGVWSATAPRWTDAGGNTAGPMSAGSFAIFQSTPGTVTVDNSAGAINVSGMQFATNGYEITGGALTLTSPLTTIRVGDGTGAGAAMTATISAPLTGSGGVLKTDFGTLVLSGDNSYSGATQIDSGTLRMGSPTALGTSGRLTINSAGILDLGGFSLGLGSIEGAGTVALAGGALTLGIGDVSSTFAGRLTGGGLFTKAGGGTLTLTGANGHTGVTRVEAGTLEAGASNVFGAASAMSIESGATLNLNHFSQSLGSLSGNGQVVLGSATLVTGIDGRDTIYNGSISGTGSVAKSGSGTWTLGGFNTYSGVTQIEAGTLRVASAGALSGTNGVSIAGGGTLDLNGFSQTFRALGGSGLVTLGGASLTIGASDASSLFGGTISGSGSLRKIGTGAFQLTGAQAYTGGTFVEGGALIGDATSLRGNIVNDGVVAFDQSATGLFNGTMSGRGGVIKRGDGVLTLTGRQSYAGGTLVSGGTLQGTTESLQGLIAVETALRFDQSFNGVFAGVLTGAGTLAKSGVGTLALLGANSISGPTTVEAGTLWLDGSLGGSVTVRSGATFAIGAFPTTITSTAAIDDVTSSERILAPRAAWMTAAADVSASIGALGRTHVAGNILLQPGSTYEARINAAGDSVLLSSGGTVIAGAATIVIDGGAAEFPRVLQTAVISAAGGVLGQPTIKASPGLETILTSDGQSLFLTVLNSNASLATAAAGVGNGAAVGAAFDRLRPTATGDLASVTRELAALSDGALGVALDGTSGEIYATSMQVTAIDAEATADRIRGEVARRRQPTTPSRVENTGAASTTAASQTAWGNGRRFWGQLGGDRARFDSTASSSAADGYVGGFAIGVDWASGGGWLAGGGGGYALGQMTLSGGANEADTAAPRAFGYVGYARGRWTLNGGGTVGRTSYDTERHIAFAATLDPRFGSAALFDGVDRTATSTSHGVDTSGWLDARVDLMRGSWLMQPGVGFRAARYGRGALTETGAAALSFSALDQSIRSNQIDGGMRFVRQQGRVRPNASASYRREIGDDATALTLQLTPDAAGRFTIEGAPFATDRLLGNFGVSMNNFWFGYGLDLSSGQTRQTVNFGVNFQ